jgi:hypothetical protein
MDEKIKKHYASLPYFFVQTKRDGSFAYLVKSNTTGADAITRQGNSYPSWFATKMAFSVPHGYALIGEMEVYESQPAGCAELSLQPPKLLDRKTGNGVLNSILQGEDETEFAQYEFKYVAWDMLYEEEFKKGKSTRKYEDRFYSLECFIATQASACIDLIENWKVTSIHEANEIHARLTKEGKEGTVWKTADGEWRDSSSGTKDAVKNKLVFEVDLEIIGSYEGTGKAAGMLGGHTVATSDRKLVNDVGSGFSDKQRKEAWEKLQADPTAFDGVILAIEANDVLTSKSKNTYSLSLPIAVEYRFDKKEADSFKRVLEQLEGAKDGK